MPKCRTKKSAYNSAVEYHEVTPGSHIVENKKSYMIKVGSKTMAKFTFKENPKQKDET